MSCCSVIRGSRAFHAERRMASSETFSVRVKNLICCASPDNEIVKHPNAKGASVFFSSGRLIESSEAKSILRQHSRQKSLPALVSSLASSSFCHSTRSAYCIASDESLLSPLYAAAISRHKVFRVELSAQKTGSVKISVFDSEPLVANNARSGWSPNAEASRSLRSNSSAF